MANMASKKRHEGYLLIDNRGSPGVSEEFVRASGKDAVAVPEGAMYEGAIITCNHCQAGVVLNPERKRVRNYCPKCDHYICDNCEAIRAVAFECLPMRNKFDKLQEKTFLDEQRGTNVLLDT